MPEQPMTLDEFEAELHADVTRFCKEWRAEAAEDFENWPLEMAAGEWGEQWLAFQDAMLT